VCRSFRTAVTRVLISLGTAIVVSMPAGVAAAEPIRASLVVTRGEGAEDCPDAAALAERVRGMTGEDMLRADASDDVGAIWISVELSRTFSGYHAVIVARGARHGTRSIDDVGPGCRSLAGALAITLVVLLDPGVRREPAPDVSARSRGNPEPSVEPAPSRQALAVAIGAPRRASDPVAVGAEAHAGATLGVLEHALPFVRGGGRVSFGRLVLGAGAAYVKPDRVSAPGGAVDLGLWFGYVLICARLASSGETSVLGCVESMAGELRGSGDAYESWVERRLPWIAASGGLELDARIGRAFRWSARALALAPLVHQAFRVELDSVPSEAFRTPPVGGQLTLGLVWEP
jgi:hypothetical protein